MAVPFAAHLSAFGPEGRHRPLSPADAHSYCARLARSHYENFTVASLLLPRRLIRHFHAVYAYCRWADDLADEVGDGQQALTLLAWWREELRACYAGRSHHPVMLALSETVTRFRIPPEPFLDLLTAFEQDQHTRSYRTFPSLLAYCACSANPVGRLVLYLGECFDEDKAALSDHICTALQLANFWQDVARDLDIGRVYLPEEDRERFHYPDEDLNARRFTPAFASLLHFEVQRTRQLFLQGFPLVERMPADLQIDIELFIRGGLSILAGIEKLEYNVWARRPEVSKWEKALLLLTVCYKRTRQRLWVW